MDALSTYVAPKVLLVDDDPAIIRLLGTALRRSGREVVECTDAESARALLQEEPWSVAILDRRLPVSTSKEIVPHLILAIRLQYDPVSLEPRDDHSPG